MPDREEYIEILSKAVKTVKEFNEDTPIKISLECIEDILKLLKEQKTVVRCKDCKAWKQYDDMNLGECELYPEYNKMGDWFCNFGERKENK